MMRAMCLSGVVCLGSAGGAVAQEFFDGTWTFESGMTGAPLLTLTLDETDGSVSGQGQLRTEVAGIGPGVISVLGGGAFEQNMQIDLLFVPEGTGQVQTTLRLMVFEGTGTLIVNGESEPGFFVASAPPVDVGPAVEPEVAPLTLLGDPGNACADMQDFAAQLLMLDEAGVAERVSEVVVTATALFPGPDSPAKCQAILGGLATIGADYDLVPASGVPPAPQPVTTPTEAAPEPMAATGIACARIEELVDVYRANGETNLVFFLEAVMTANEQVADAADRELNCEAVLTGLDDAPAIAADPAVQVEGTQPRDSFEDGPSSTGQLDPISPGIQQSPTPTTGPDSSGAILTPAFE